MKRQRQSISHGARMWGKVHGSPKRDLMDQLVLRNSSWVESNQASMTKFLKITFPEFSDYRDWRRDLEFKTHPWFEQGQKDWWKGAGLNHGIRIRIRILNILFKIDIPEKKFFCHMSHQGNKDVSRPTKRVLGRLVPWTELNAAGSWAFSQGQYQLKMAK